MHSTDPIPQYTCEECGQPAKEYHRFCHHCGAFLGVQVNSINIFNNAELRSAFFFYLIYLFICLVVHYTDWFINYDRLFWIEIALAFITIYYAYKNKESIGPILRFNNFKWGIAALVITVALSFSIVVNLAVREMNVSLFQSDTNYFDFYKIYVAPIPIMIYSIALMPAIFEEIAFRGILFNYLSTFLDDKLVVMVTGFVFAAMHLSTLSLIWLIPFGILLGIMRNKYSTIWYGVIFHFVFNLTSCLIDLYQQGELWWQ